MTYRDMSQTQFDRACEKAGFRAEGLLGYYRVTASLSVSILNAGPRRRAQLAYLYEQRAKGRRRERASAKRIAQKTL